MSAIQEEEIEIINEKLEQDEEMDDILADLVKDDRYEFYSLTLVGNTLGMWEHYINEDLIINKNMITYLRSWRSQHVLDSLPSLLNKKQIKIISRKDLLINNNGKNEERKTIMYFDPFKASRLFMRMKLTSKSSSMQEAKLWIKKLAELPEEEIWFWTWKTKQLGDVAVNSFRTMYRQEI